MNNSIVIVDFGSQYTFLIAKNIRNIGIYCTITYPDNLLYENVKNNSAIILSGGPQSVHDGTFAHTFDQIKLMLLDPKLPVLGVCFGLQLIAHLLGGKVEAHSKPEFGEAIFFPNNSHRSHPIISWLFDDSIDRISSKIWMSHSDSVVQVPPDFKTLGATSSIKHAIIVNDDIKVCGIQFHPEVTHTYNGVNFIKGFIGDVCNVKYNWTIEQKLNQCITHIKNFVQPDDHVVLGLSGGVDSTVTATILLKALSRHHVSCIFVNNGLLRMNEQEEVEAMCKKLDIPLYIVDYSKVFFSRLESGSNPEWKRHVIGKTFIDAFEFGMKTYIQEKLDPGGQFVLAQGTIYPDVVESAKANHDATNTNKQHLIKSHHNVGGLPDKLGWRLLEPLKWLFKDEVRQLGRHLGIPDSFIDRHPFPGPGIAVRIVGPVFDFLVDVVRKADKIFIDELKKLGIYHNISQAYAALLNCKAVGVVGDTRREGYIILLRAVCTDDFMTASVYEFEKNVLTSIATKIVNEIDLVARVVYDVTSKPPGTIELE